MDPAFPSFLPPQYGKYRTVPHSRRGVIVKFVSFGADLILATRIETQNIIWNLESGRGWQVQNEFTLKKREALNVNKTLIFEPNL